MLSTKTNIALLILLALCSMTQAQSKKSSAGEMAFIGGGKYTPLYGSSKNGISINVEPFYIDKYPVTNEQFLKFIRSNPKWRRSNVKNIFADKNYLSTWKSDLELGETALPNSPVTNISWFAAKAYCEYYGKRLPTVAEWEFVAKADEKKPDGSKNPAYLKQILDWYSKPSSGKIGAVGEGEKNYWNVYDMHGLVWEWTSDFFSSLVTGESRGDSGLERNLFCGSGSVNASDFKNYPAFMRFAFRSSLKANYTTANLGFRCAKK
jgi:formylglycine-generating enzyme required for sulfatase activity